MKQEQPKAISVAGMDHGLFRGGRVWTSDGSFYRPPMSISPVMPKDGKTAVAWVLDVYAAATHHQAGHGSGKGESVSGSGDPEWRAIFSEPDLVNATSRQCERSDDLYDATRDKYRRHPRSDVRVLYCSKMAEDALRPEPEVVHTYILATYPRAGCYAPCFAEPKHGYMELPPDPVKAFTERGRQLGVKGFHGSLSHLEKLLRQRERRVKDRIREMIGAEGDPYGTYALEKFRESSQRFYATLRPSV